MLCLLSQALVVLQCLIGLSHAAQVVIPFALAVPPSQRWEGIDGPWSSFSIQVGSPAQDLTVFVSTAGNQPLVALPDGCTSSTFSTCQFNGGGGFFDRNTSTTWTQSNFTAEDISAIESVQNVECSANIYGSLYGNDAVALSSLSPGTTSLSNQLIGGIASTDFFMGSLGLNPDSTNLSSSNASISSYMSNLKSQNKIPSLSYGYTAGNQYRFDKVLGSLTLGGYDASLFQSNNLTVALNGKGPSDLTINVNSIYFTSSSDKRSLSNREFPAVIDSTVPYLYLPIEICQRFEEAFGITYDEDFELYLVNDTMHSRLLEQAANVTFTLTNVTSEVLINITLPYQAFDLLAEPPLVQTTSRYFPLKRASDTSQSILGRAFLQEAYLIADYERAIFSISQRKWDPTTKEDIRTILPPSSPIIINPSPPQTTVTAEDPESKPSRSKSRTAIIIAAAVGGTVLIIIFSVLLGYTLIYRLRTRQIQAPIVQNYYEPPESKVSLPIAAQFCTDLKSPGYTVRSELDAIGTLIYSPGVAGIPSVPMLPPIPAARNSRGMRSLHELPGDHPVPELFGSPVFLRPVDGRQNELREYEDYRRRVGKEQKVRRDTFMRMSP